MKRICKKCSTPIPVGARLCASCGGKDHSVVGESGERRSESGSCEQVIIGARSDPREQCGADGTLRENGKILCDAHWALEARRLVDIKAITDQAAEYCLIHGVESVRGHANASRLASMLRRPPGKAWAYRLQEQQRAGRKLLPIQIELMAGALRSDQADEDQSIYEV